MERVKMHKGQRYEFVGMVDHVKEDGSTMLLQGWFSHCAECGNPMLVKIVPGCTPSRRCKEHAKPGVRV
jgi:hypothetical protein